MCKRVCMCVCKDEGGQRDKENKREKERSEMQRCKDALCKLCKCVCVGVCVYLLTAAGINGLHNQDLSLGERG